MKKKVLCIGDSLVLPREEVKYEETWYYLLKEKYNQCDFTCYLTRALLMPMTNDLFHNYYQYYCPDIVIWESGITDSAPRYFQRSKRLWKWALGISTILKCENLFWKNIKKYRTRDPKYADTSLKDFEYYAELLVKNFIKNGVKKIVLLAIEPVALTTQVKSPLWMDNIRKYNEVYEKLAEKYSDYVILISPKKNATDDCFIKDGYHPNAKGMRLAFEGIDETFNKLV